MDQFRMLLLGLMVFGCLSGVLGNNKLCKLQAYKACGTNYLPKDMPKTEQEMASDCELQRKITDCINDNLKNCHLPDQAISSADEEYLIVRGMRLEVLQTICILKPDMYSKLISSKDCMNNIMRKPQNGLSKCDNEAKEDLVALQWREGTTFTRVVEDCLSGLIHFNCYIDVYNKVCGSDARDVSIQIFKKTENWDKRCPLDIRGDIPELLDDLHSLTQKEIYVKDFLVADDIF